METTEVKKIQGMSYASIALVQLLENGKPGDVLTDEQLKDACGYDCRPGKRGYSNLKTATIYILNNKNMVWARIRQADAIKCLNDSEIAEYGKWDLTMTHKRIKRTIKRTRNVDLTKLCEADRKSFIVTSAQIATMALVGNNSTTKKLEQRNISEHFRPSLPQITNLFANN